MMLHFPTPVYICVHVQTHVLMFPYHTSTHAYVCIDMHMCTHTVTCAHMHTNSHMHTHPYACMHIHTCAHAHIQCAYLYTCTDCLPHACTHTHTQIPTRTHVLICTHAYISPHRLPHPRTCTHVCTHSRTCTHCTSCCRPCFSHHHEEYDVSESLLTLLPLLRPCSRPDRDVVRRGRPAPGQYLELQSLALSHVSSC